MLKLHLKYFMISVLCLMHLNNSFGGTNTETGKLTPYRIIVNTSLSKMFKSKCSQVLSNDSVTTLNSLFEAIEDFKTAHAKLKEEIAKDKEHKEYLEEEYNHRMQMPVQIAYQAIVGPKDRTKSIIHEYSCIPLQQTIRNETNVLHRLTHLRRQAEMPIIFAKLNPQYVKDAHQKLKSAYLLFQNDACAQAKNVFVETIHDATFKTIGDLLK